MIDIVPGACMVPRRDLSEQRTEQILDAFAACVAEVGVDGTSLEMIAERAGVRRSILRHYVGNREDLILALAEREAERHRRQIAAMRAYLPKKRAIKPLLKILIPANPWDSSTENAVVDALIRVADRYPRVQELMSRSVNSIIEAVAEVLEREYPDAKAKACWSVAYGIVSISFTFEGMTPLDPPKTYRKAAIDSAERLVRSLADS